MSNYTVSVPGDVLDEKVVFGLTFGEIIALASVPLVIVLPVLLPIPLVPDLPLPVILGLIVVGTVFVGVIIAATPTGQSPIVWFPAHVTRRLNPDKYQLKPRDNTEYGSPDVVYKDVVYTARLLREENEKDEITIDYISEMIYKTRNAEKLELQDGITEDEVIESLKQDGETNENRKVLEAMKDSTTTVNAEKR